MGMHDYDAGRGNPFGTTPLGREFDLDYQFGQQDERRRIEEIWRASAAPAAAPAIPETSAVPTAAVPASNASPAIVPVPARPHNVVRPRKRKSLIVAVVLAALFGPFGALYVSQRVALGVIVPFLAIGFYFALRNDFAGYQTLWSIAVPAAVIYVAAAVLLSNTRRG